MTQSPAPAPFPPSGATHFCPQGVTNFAVFSSAATDVTLVLFTEEGLAAGEVAHEVPLDGGLNRTGDTWHIALPALDPTLLYGEEW